MITIKTDYEYEKDFMVSCKDFFEFHLYSIHMVGKFFSLKYDEVAKRILEEGLREWKVRCDILSEAKRGDEL